MRCEIREDTSLNLFEESFSKFCVCIKEMQLPLQVNDNKHFLKEK
jgi:hypothetical protein